MSRFSVENFLSHSAEIFVGQALGCQYFEVSKNFMLQRVMSRFSVEIFCLRLPKNFVRELFYAVFQKNSGSQKVCG